MGCMNPSCKNEIEVFVDWSVRRPDERWNKFALALCRAHWQDIADHEKLAYYITLQLGGEENGNHE